MSTEMISVPRRLIEEIAEYLQKGQEETVSVPGNGEWTRRMVGTLKAEIVGYKGALATGDLAAERAGQLVTLDEVVETFDKLEGARLLERHPRAASHPRRDELRRILTKKQVSSDLGGMTKAARRLFGKKLWPFQALQSGAGMTYLMKPEIARWWMEA